MKFLLTGRNGQVGWELERALMSVGEIFAFDRQSFDLAKPDQIVARVRDIEPDVIFNAGAYTAVDVAEKEPNIAMAVNGIAPGVLAEEAKRLGSLLVHYSTDYVFDGTKAGPYTEQDAPNPVNVYGKTKLRGEQAIRDSGCRHLILRTSWVYAARGKNFLLAIVRHAREKQELRVVADQHGAPTWARDIAEASVKIVRDQPEADGIFHVTAAGETTWCGFAKAIMELKEIRTPVVPISGSEYPVAAARPANSILSNSKLLGTFGFSLPDWSTGLRHCLAAQ